MAKISVPIPAEDSLAGFDRLDRRLAMAFGGLILTLMVIVLVAGGWYLRGVMEREQDRLSTILTQVLANAVSRVSFSGRYHAGLMLREIRAAQPNIRYLRILDPYGQIVADGDPDGADKPLDPDARAIVARIISGAEREHVRYVDLAGESVREISLRYHGGYRNDVLGVIQVGVSERQLEQALVNGLAIIATLVAGLLAVGILVTRRLSRAFGAPVRHLAADMAATLNAIPDLLFEMDRDGRYLQVLTNRRELLAASRSRLLGHLVTEMLPPQAAATIMQAIEEADRHGESHGKVIGLPLEIGERWFELSVSRKQDSQGGQPRFIVLSRDITERQESQRQLRLAATVFDNSQEGILVTDPRRRILRVNAAFTRLTGYEPDEVLGRPPDMLQSGHHDEPFYRTMMTSLEQRGFWQGEVVDRCKDGQLVPVLLSISVVKGDDGQVENYVAVMTDISQIKLSEAKLEHQAHHDLLTDLPNRLMLNLRAGHALDRARREGRKLALLMLDLDRFKDINDSFGHLMGDALLREVAARLAQRMRRADTVCRLGGDEFTVLLEDIVDDSEAAVVAEDLIRDLSEPYQLPNGAEVTLGASVGIALYPDHGDSEEVLLQGADAALYQAKAEGRGRYRYFSDAMTAAVRDRVALETRLRQAIKREEFLVYYQPQSDVATGRVIGAEALVRWNHPDEGLVSPARFIPVAEHSGLIHAIGLWVLREACRQGRAWLDAGLPAINLAVNVSPRQFMRDDLAERVADILTETGFPAERLELELTESALMEQEAAVFEMLAGLRRLGVRLAIDDFGTGYSSLAYLKRFPLDSLKIDKSFVDDIPKLQDDMEITATIIAMAHTLRLSVLAEGVETEAQLAFLAERGCDYYQGYLKSPPLSAEQFARFLAA